MDKEIKKQLFELYSIYNKVQSILNKLQEENDCFEDFNLNSMQLVKNCTVNNDELWCDNKRLAKGGLVDNLYFCNQSKGYCEDDYNGYMYFSIDDQGTYLKVYYESY